MTIYGIDCNALTLPHRTGVERYVARLLTELQKTPLAPNERVVLYSATPLKEWTQLPAGWENRVLPFTLPKGWTHLRLSWELHRHPPTVFFSPAHEIPFGVRAASKVVSTVHDVAFAYVPWVYAPQAVRRQRLAIARAVKKATTLLAVSATTKHDLETTYHVDPARIALTRLGVDAERFVVSDAACDATLARYRLTRGAYLFYVGRLEEKKNIVTLVQGFVAMKQALGVGHPTTLILAGSPGFGKEKIARVLRHAGDDVRAIGFVPDEDVPSLMKGALALCFASHYEGFGLPVLEAFAAGTPVVASDIPAFHEVAGDAALFASPQSSGAWSQALRRVVLEEDTRHALVTKGSARLQDFTWHNTATATWQALRQAAAK